LLALWIGNTVLLEDFTCHWERRLPLGLEFRFERAVVNSGDGPSCNRKSPVCVSVNSIRSNEKEKRGSRKINSELDIPPLSTT
jgi:hypothetical protein